MEKTIWTIGHSTRPIAEFTDLLKSFFIELLIDVRSYPGSRRYPQFNKENLSLSLNENGIEYVHLKELGGRRKPREKSKNTAWKNSSFRGYADYMETEEFKNGVNKVFDKASSIKSAVMCAEAPWWRCHRSLISDYLKLNGWNVIHIIDPDKAENHTYTKPVKIKQGNLFYSE